MISTDIEEPGPGEYAIIELLGHSTLVGRIDEVERFGTKMLMIEALFRGQLLSPIYQGGASIYRLTPVPREIALQRQPTETYQLPVAVRSIVPPTLLPTPAGVVDREEFEDLVEADHGLRGH